ncbi:DUF1304 domain-containing protein [Microbacterium capsulatum]|uniref:DUF1304 domain-containing protein n=1 Tax=Microbacterium capsulatum TaxID=3041921 RepID=A0ABU0XDR3_9MICO|nr:DUF1304 domain-containing protein [Microbacterium sp. ASV81]MDQ4212325.1 DUF1304 domain-containing protein [Microbacterium sp. ASV81]
MFFVIGAVLAGLGALIHVYIFVLESVRWTHTSTRRIFGVATEADARTMKQLAFNQGFYNLFLAILVVIGVVVALGSGVWFVVGWALTLAGVGMMLAAALVLVLSDRTKLRAATVQGLLPLLAVVALVVAVI